MSLNKNLLFLLVASLSLLSCERLDKTRLNQEGAKRESRNGVDSTKPLIPSLRLRKLSIHLRGLPPSEIEYEKLKDAVKNAKTSEFFELKAKEYLASPQHIGKMITRLDELFRFRTAAGLPEYRLTHTGGAVLPAYMPGGETLNAFDLVVEDVVKKNLPWDALFTSKRYTIATPQNVILGASTDLTFYSLIAPELAGQVGPSDKQKLIPLEFQGDDPRVAGVITTGRFFGRYSTTNLNRNRGRSAALFRTLLCDDMRAVVEPKPGEEEALLKMAFPPPKPISVRFASHGGIDPLDEDKHTKDPACIACHYKLDPLGRGFMSTGSSLGEDPSPGRLTYRRFNGEMVDVAGSGIGALAAAIVAQPEYAGCQVNHFWKWFIRGDELPSSKRHAELMKAFEQVGRRTNDFIQYLVSQPEFTAEDLEEDIPSIVQVRHVLNRCTQCHSGLTEEKIPSFSQLPFESTEKHEYWAKAITFILDLSHDGAGKKMPPKSSAWQPSIDEIALLKAFVAGGLRDEAGKVTIDQEKTKDWLTPKEDAAKMKFISFRHSVTRYLSGHDVMRMYENWFQLPADCQQLSDKNRSALGDPNPANGEINYRTASATYVKLLTKCLEKGIQTTFEKNDAKKWEEYFGKDSIAAIKEAKLEAALTSPKSIEWSKIPLTIQKKIISGWIRYFVGPDIAKDEVSLNDKLLRATSETGLSVFQASARIALFLTTDDAVISY